MDSISIGNIVSTAIIILLTSFVGVLVWVFKDTRQTLRKEIEGLGRSYELLEAKFHEFENEKYVAIMNILNAMKVDIAVIKNELGSLKENK